MPCTGFRVGALEMSGHGGLGLGAREQVQADRALSQEESCRLANVDSQTRHKGCKEILII